MSADTIARPRQGRLDSLIDRLGRRYFPEFPLSTGDTGAVVAQFYRSRVTTAFQPITRARNAERVGNHALLRVESASGESIAPWGLFAQAGDDAALVNAAPYGRPTWNPCSSSTPARRAASACSGRSTPRARRWMPRRAKASRNRCVSRVPNPVAESRAT